MIWLVTAASRCVWVMAEQCREDDWRGLRALLHRADTGNGSLTRLQQAVSPRRRSEVHDHLVSIYQDHAPDKLHSVGNIMAAFVGAEEDLFRRVYAK